MGIFNEHSNNQQQRGFLRGLQGAPGVGLQKMVYKRWFTKDLTKDGNYDMINKKLKNLGEGVETTDAITKHQLEVSLNTKLYKTSLTNYVKKNSPKVKCRFRYERLCNKKFESNTWWRCKCHCKKIC